MTGRPSHFQEPCVTEKFVMSGTDALGELTYISACKQQVGEGKAPNSSTRFELQSFIIS